MLPTGANIPRIPGTGLLQKGYVASVTGSGHASRVTVSGWKEAEFTKKITWRVIRVVSPQLPSRHLPL